MGHKQVKVEISETGYCNNWRGGFRCTRDAGHPGTHIATRGPSLNNVFAAWDDIPEEAVNPPVRLVSDTDWLDYLIKGISNAGSLECAQGVAHTIQKARGKAEG